MQLVVIDVFPLLGCSQHWAGRSECRRHARAFFCVGYQIDEEPAAEAAGVVRRPAKERREYVSNHSYCPKYRVPKRYHVQINSLPTHGYDIYKRLYSIGDSQSEHATIQAPPPLNWPPSVDPVGEAGPILRPHPLL